MAIIISIIVNSPDDIPRKSNDIFVFLDLRYYIAFANSLSFRLSILVSSFLDYPFLNEANISFTL